MTVIKHIDNPKANHSKHHKLVTRHWHRQLFGAPKDIVKTVTLQRTRVSVLSGEEKI